MEREFREGREVYVCVTLRKREKMRGRVKREKEMERMGEGKRR